MLLCCDELENFVENSPSQAAYTRRQTHLRKAPCGTVLRMRGVLRTMYDLMNDTYTSCLLSGITYFILRIIQGKYIGRRIVRARAYERFPSQERENIESITGVYIRSAGKQTPHTSRSIKAGVVHFFFENRFVCKCVVSRKWRQRADKYDILRSKTSPNKLLHDPAQQPHGNFRYDILYQVPATRIR